MSVFTVAASTAVRRARAHVTGDGCGLAARGSHQSLIPALEQVRVTSKLHAARCHMMRPCTRTGSATSASCAAVYAPRLRCQSRRACKRASLRSTANVSLAWRHRQRTRDRAAAERLRRVAIKLPSPHEAIMGVHRDRDVRRCIFHVLSAGGCDQTPRTELGDSAGFCHGVVQFLSATLGSDSDAKLASD